ncbi:MAG: DUF4129 domain-containing protein [Candidatus Thiodiazotropha sp. (ex Ctena orbiculata)]|nr:DUF4129 domain-containing protein [Candidatus Thiodiazotropha taylori]PUB86644.1 MAG: hypothetical protein DBP00_11065 [gamma proteobacterium symbiont of Ctena orbiculata]MBT2995761.1 DUF4129 domain-containing protein [Candidatus Thiodiazotropha taylori]MBT2999076.1 DUF4129 domain-containing protein [Candidatus Thiodiazotropha taylori]MBV2108634.1 DUF4129 domain-containing protein [Candidatus Thiodiazotropha taylori]
MNLARIAVKLRPRQAWESIDLGFAMARKWYLSLWLLWLCSALPVMVVLALLPLPLWLAGLLLWWLKPLYEPPLLFWLSRRLFAEDSTIKSVFRGWLRIVLPQLLANLTWRRLNPSRSFVMPVVVLEGLKGRRRSNRIGVLSRGVHAAGWLTLVGLAFEVVLELGFIVLVIGLIPQELMWIDWQSYFIDPDPLTEWVHQGCALLAMSCIAPFYVSGGFALYLNRRSQLEAWDLEIGLRNMAQRHHRIQRLGAASLFVAAVLLVAAVLPQPAEALQLDPQESRQLIDEVLADEVFGRYREFGYWKPIGDESDEVEHNWLLEWLEQVLGGFTRNIAFYTELVVWLAAGVILAYLLYWFMQNRTLLPGAAKRQREGNRQIPSQIAGLDLRPETLPADPAAEAASLIEQGDYRGGFGLLYRAALSVLIHDHSIAIAEGATEGECLLSVRGVMPDESMRFFSRLTGVWQQTAYGHIQPAKEEALDLCREWPGYFGVSGEE